MKLENEALRVEISEHGVELTSVSKKGQEKRSFRRRNT